MQHTIENDILRLTVDTHGAEAVSVIHKPTGAELLWRGDKAVWGASCAHPVPLYRQADRRQDDCQREWSIRAASTVLPGMWSIP